MASHRTCDFCGEEIQARDLAAVLSINRGGNQPRAFSPWAMFGAPEADPNVRSLEMCSECLGHLMPVTERIRRERAEARRAKEMARPNTVSSTELSPVMAEFLEQLKRDLK